MIHALRRDDIRDRVMRFAGGPLSEGVRGGRSQSYDHCYNYFIDHHDRLTDDVEKSCAVLGHYLASWGMYRGSSYLFKHTNSAHFVPLIEYVRDSAVELRSIDLPEYESKIDRISSAYKEVGELALGGTTSVRVTLATKIMIAAFGCVPAFDTYFRMGMQRIQQDLPRRQRVAFDQLDEPRLRRLSEFYRANQADIDQLHQESRTVRFPDGAPTVHRLTRAKIIDMYVFDLGMNP
ncbi:hypothetical protein AWC18_18780 [Mycolicibacter nonchromogenicus]|uniref:Uncharacterized protein n=1 Tax=Mycolicibacter nonchromogenicus TaxID=1782 RepID=A0A1X1YZB7_MYCNO|nr:hypothetical protein AWC18_18780 [Mycolicibacter nonchromogenicus]